MRTVACVLAVSLSACSASDPAPSRAAETLEGVSAAFADARAKGDGARLLELTKALLPTLEDLKKIVRAGPASDAFLLKYDAEGIRAHADGASKEILKPKDATQTVVQVHSATTEELVAYAKGSVAFAEFPGGMVRFASEIAAPGRVWQVIEYLAPGSEEGMKFTCFTVLDGRVLMVVKPWRAIPRKVEPGVTVETGDK